MIKKLIDKLLGTNKPVRGKRVEVPASEHRIDLGLVDDNAIRVVKTLADAGFEAYIVGGAVRDLLVGRRPKDFDVATNATPEEVKGLFRRAFIIGRRFRIVHVVFGRGRDHEVIEVSTFRAVMDASAAEQVSGNEKSSKSELANKNHAVDASGRVLRDNVWGPQIEDAARRDFTVNAMYYDPQRQIVVDYHGGIKDSGKKVLRMIGDPATRYREDPVRIVRVVRFAAKLGFTIEAKTRAPIREMARLLLDVPASRTFDEMIKLLQTGHALSSIAELKKQGLLGLGIFPVVDQYVEQAGKHPERAAFVEAALADTDRRVEEGKPVAPSFMLACLLWHDVQDRWAKLKSKGEAPFPALQQAIDAVFDARIGDISGRGKLGADMREIWLMQPRFERRTGNGPLGLVEQPRFRAGFDFLRLRADVGEVDADLAAWWESFSVAHPDDRPQMVQDLRKTERRAPRSPRAAAPVAAPEVAHDHEHEDDDELPPPESGDAPRKRRRRRRKPAGSGASDSAA